MTTPVDRLTGRTGNTPEAHDARKSIFATPVGRLALTTAWQAASGSPLRATPARGNGAAPHNRRRLRKQLTAGQTRTVNDPILIDDDAEPTVRVDLLDAARRFARGRRQKACLYFLVDGHEGLDRGYQGFRTKAQRDQDVFLLRLREAGFRIEERTVGSRGKRRSFLAASDADLGLAFRIVRRVSDLGTDGSGAALDPAAAMLVERLTADELVIADALASNDWTGSVDDLATTCQQVAY